MRSPRRGGRASRAPRDSAWAPRGATPPKARSSTASSTMVRGVRALGMEACCTLGMLTQEQADALAAAGLSAYNHNLDTSPEFYGSIITTRDLRGAARYDRARPPGRHHGLLRRHHRHGRDRDGRAAGLLHQLASLDPHPESVPINLLARVEGTPLGDRPAEDPLELVRTIATARILMPAVLRAAERRPRCRSPPKRRRCASWPAPTPCFSATAADDAESGGGRRPTAVRGSRPAAAGRRRGMTDGPGRSSSASARRLRAIREGQLQRTLAPADRHRLLVERLPRSRRVIRASKQAMIARRRARAASAAPARGCCAAIARPSPTSSGSFAAFKGTERALYFSSGYLANLAVLTTLPERGDVIFSDERNHASLIDGVRLSAAGRVVFPHNDVGGARARASRASRRQPGVRGHRVAVQHGRRRAAAGGLRRAVPIDRAPR